MIVVFILFSIAAYLGIFSWNQDLRISLGVFLVLIVILLQFILITKIRKVSLALRKQGYHLNVISSQIKSQNSWTMGLIYDQTLKLNEKYPIDDVTVIIPIKNRYDFRLENALKSLRNQDYRQDLIKIIVVDYDGLLEFINPLKKLCQKFDAKYIRIEERPVWCKSECLNVGIGLQKRNLHCLQMLILFSRVII